MHTDKIMKGTQKTQSTGVYEFRRTHTHTHVHTRTHTDEWQQLDGETKHVRTEER